MAADMAASMFSMISMFNMHVCVCACMCMHVHVCVHGTPPTHTHTHPHPHAPICHPPGGGPPESVKIR